MRPPTARLGALKPTLPGSLRLFSTTPSPFYRQPPVPNSDLPIPSVTANQPHIPPYPLGPRQVYHQSNTGLYGSACIRFGNKVSDKNEIKTRRAWRPNVHHKRLWSVALGVYVRTRVTTRVLRTIDKVGGLDNYLLGIKSARLRELGPWGWKLRWRVMQSDKVKEEMRLERERLGLPPKEDVAEMSGGLVGSVEEGEAVVREVDGLVEREEEIALGDEGFMREEPKVKA
ncbi:hypothetical protein OQA88_8916 [Cercophora sp. LCS_1]